MRNWCFTSVNCKLQVSIEIKNEQWELKQCRPFGLGSAGFRRRVVGELGLNIGGFTTAAVLRSGGRDAGRKRKVGTARRSVSRPLAIATSSLSRSLSLSLSLSLSVSLCRSLDLGISHSLSISISVSRSLSLSLSLYLPPRLPPRLRPHISICAHTHMYVHVRVCSCKSAGVIYVSYICICNYTCRCVYVQVCCVYACMHACL